MKHETLTDGIIGCIVKVHRALGPGFLEAIYRRALVIELQRVGMKVEVEKQVVVFYEGVEVGVHRLDLVVEDAVVLELKAVPELLAAHYEQIRSYLRASGIELGLLINFGRERSDFRRNAYPLHSSEPVPACSTTRLFEVDAKSHSGARPGESRSCPVPGFPACPATKAQEPRG